MRYGLLLLFLAAPFAGARGQLVQKEWQSLGTFPRGVDCVYFLDLPGPPRIGFVGDSGNVFRTTDGGATWRAAQVTPGDSIIPSDFTFENPDTGWFANFFGGGPPVYETTDAGQSWTAIAAPAPHATAIYYNRSNGLLFLSSWDFLPAPGGVYVSSDGGRNWITLFSGDSYNGFAFMNGDSGIVTERDIGAYRTIDGGYSWRFGATNPDETWQADPDSLRRVIWEASERGLDSTRLHSRPNGESILYETTDFGTTFSPFLTIPAITGTMREGSCGTLYLQSTSFASPNVEGILRSADGIVWTPLTDTNGNPGPVGSLDTRFYVKGDYVFAGGTMPGEDDSIRLWRYVEDSTKYADSVFAAPAASTKDFHIVSTSCFDLDSTLYVIYHNDCIPAILVSAELAPSPRFVLHLRDSLPRQTSGYYPIGIEHVPNGRSFDTTELYLHYYANGEDFFDTVLVSAQLLGADVAAPFDILVDGVKNARVAAGDTVRFRIRLTDSISSRARLDSLTFTMSFDGDVLSFQSAKALPPWALLGVSHAEGSTSITLQPPPGQTAQPDTAIANIFYTANIALNASTNYIIRDIRLNDVSFDGCAGVASLPVPPTVTVVGCADTILRNVIAGQPIVQLLGIESAPGGPAILLRSAEDIPLECEIYNEIGEPVRSFTISPTSGITERVLIPASGLANGLYFCTIRSGGNTWAAGRFVINK